MFGSSVRMTDLGPRDGLICGEIGHHRWEVRRARGPVSYGLNPQSLYKGAGRIVRLVLFAHIPGTGCWRKVAAFDRGWQFGRAEYLSAIRRVVRYLEAE